jgi:alpha-D-ribose 1-methylphosphonate 5-triphosphate diphosphatase
VDLRVHARFEVTNPRAEPILRDLLERGMVDMVSLTDHTPGQGQYRDLEQYISYATRTSGTSAEEAAERARRRMAAPPAWEIASHVTAMARARNLRGRSMTGNITALSVLDAGLLDALAADYHQGAMLPAVLAWVRQGRIALHEAVALLTANPARAAALDDRGVIALGRRADLMLVDLSEAEDAPPPRVRAVWRDGRLIHSDGWAAPAVSALAEAA